MNYTLNQFETPLTEVIGKKIIIDFGGRLLRLKKIYSTKCKPFNYLRAHKAQIIQEKFSWYLDC